MKSNHSILTKAISSFLALTIAGTLMVPAAFAREKNDYIKALLKDKEAPYDLIIRFNSEGMDGLSRKEKADLAQSEAKELLTENKKNVEEWESFYITNAIHAEITSEDLVYELAELSDVDKITWNGYVERVEPIEDEEDVWDNNITLFSASIFKPDKRDIEWGVIQVHADKVWEDFNIDGTGSVVGIIDGGANFNLPALKKAYKDYDAETDSIIEKEDDPDTDEWEGGAYRDFVDGSDTPQKTSSDDHGTHVAGTIVGAEGENLNRIGVAPGAKFITARAMGVDGGEEADLIAAAEWMLEMHPDVINNSWGGAADDDTWFKDVVDAWVEAGIVPVFAAGNTSGSVPGAGTISNPANYPNVLAVAAVDRDKKIGNFSNKGPSAFKNAGTKPEISAPGVQVRSVDSGGTYVSWNGTSMAAPHVTGVVALLRQAAKKAGKEEQYDSLDEIRDLLEDTAEPLTDETYTDYPNIAYGYGLINAYDAVAKIMGSDMIEIKGTVLQDGEDTDNPEISFDDKLTEGYIGRDVRVNVNISDAVSIRSATLKYTIAGKEPVTEKLTLASGVQNDGIYSFTIPGADLAKGTLHLEATAVDYGNHAVTIQKDIEIKPGMTLPWSQDFEDAENGLPGFLVEGCWDISERASSGEPELPEGMNGGENKVYIGIDGGYSFFERRIDSNLYLPPIDLSDVTAAEHPSLNVDMYNGFTGISVAKIQVSQTGAEDSWKDLYHVILRPDITDRSWQHCTFSLADYAGSDKPLQIRFYFFGHDADDGCGWYLDNMSVVTDEKTAPTKVQSLHGNVSGKGLRVSFDANEETDLTGYSIERKELSGTFTEIATIEQDLDSFQFVNKGEEESRPESHYHVNYYDPTAETGHTYVYRVRAYDFTGNYSEYSDELTVYYNGYLTTVSYDFEDSDGGFTSGTLSGSVNDWEWGKPERPEGTDMTLLFNYYAWGGLEKNGTNVWGTKLSAKPSAQDSYLIMPSVTVREGDYLYFDSYCGMKSVSDMVSFTVDIKEHDKEIWLPLISRETVMNDDQTFTWWQIGTTLEAYEGKEVDIRFHSVTGGWLDSYNLGWYIDNIFVGKNQIDYTTDESVSTNSMSSQSARGLELASKAQLGYNDQTAINGEPFKLMSTEGTSDGTSGIPIRALVTVEGSGRYTHSSEIDGSYSIRQAASGSDSYTLVFTAYGYKTERVTVNGDESGTIAVPTVYMEKAAKTSLSGAVKDSEGNALEDAKVRLIEDENVPVLTTDANGGYSSSDAYAGTYTARFYKDGYRSVEKEITLTEDGANTVEDVILTPLGEMETEKTDYGYIEDTDSEGNYQTIQFTSGPHGMAVRFQSPHIGGILKSADIFLVQNQYYSGDHILIGVIGYDDKGRLREIAPFREYERLTANKWNTIDFSEFTIETDNPVYVAATYDKSEFSECMGVYYDTDATETAVSKSFIYDGSFTATSTMSPTGAYAVKASWLYPANAEVNPESDASDGAGGGDLPVLDDETAFVFDAETQTITGYNGRGGAVTIPAEIGGVKVLHIGNGAFDGTGKDTDKKLTSIVIPEGIETIGDDAFKTNKIASIKLPSTLTEIGARAFQYQYAENMQLDIPEGVTVIKESAFKSLASPLKVTMSGVTKIEKESFDGIRDIEVYADSLKEIEDEAFGSRYTSDFPYAKVYTTEDTSIKSVKNQYLINPASVTITEINARDHEDIFGTTVYYGNGQTSIGRNQEVSTFYTIGDEVTIAPPDIMKSGVRYSSADAAVTMTLKKENKAAFYYYTLAPRMRTPILDIDEEILGFALPNAEIEITAGDKTYTETANADGYFKADIDKQTAGTAALVKVNGKSTSSETVTAYNNEEYIIDGTVIRRYFGTGGNITLPVSGGESGSITEIGDFAFCGSELKSVILPDTAETIGLGAFMETSLESYGWNLQDINSAKLVYINEYAFRGDNLTNATMPELTHVIRTGAFENNKITDVQLGKYTAHIGDRAFKNNKIKSLTMADRAEEIGEEAFMDNEIESLTIKPWMEGYDDGLSEIPARAFANNKMIGVTLPDTITYVDETAFDGNTSDGVRFVVDSDAEEIVPTANYDVRRSNGILLKFTKTFLDLLDSFDDTIQIEKTEGLEDSAALILSNKENNDGELSQLEIYIAGYNGNILQGVSKIEFTGEGSTKTAIIPKQTGDYKIFIWTDGMQPVINPITPATDEPNKLF